ncbi:oxidoreductase [Rhodococcus koreensis]
MNYPNLFSEFQVGSLRLRNRTAMAAMSSGLADANGRITNEQIAYYAERARGGLGLVTVEFACVDSSYGLSEATQVVIDGEDAIEGHRKLVDAIKAEGAAAALQLQMPGQFAHRQPGLTPVAPSDVLSRRDGTFRARELRSEEIDEIISRFAMAASRAVRAGYDAIELHGAHGYLLNAFMSPALNHRTDEWGGDFERRLKFPTAVIRAVKAAIGERPLFYRFSGDEYIDGGLTIDDMVQIAPLLVEAGADALNVSTGSLAGSLERTIDPMSEEGWRFTLTRRIRESVNVPVVAIGSRRPESADRAIRDGVADMIALGRPLLADAEWASKAYKGRATDIRICTSCNWCADRVFKHLPTGCAENPRTGREIIPLLPRDVGRSRRVVVVGGGPGGLAAAVQADSVGFVTTLFESEPVLGGGLISSAAPPNKDNLLWYRDYLAAKALAGTIDVRLGTTARMEDILRLDPFAVLLAQGARPNPPGIPGDNAPHVVSAYDLLLGKGPDPMRWSGPVIVYGGGETGCETAELIAAHGLAVTLITRSSSSHLARAAEPLYRKVLLRRLNSNPLVTIVDLAHITAIEDGKVTIARDSASEFLPAEMVVLAQGRHSIQELHANLTERGITSILLGDSRDIGRIGEAVHSANTAIRDLVGSSAEAPPA